MIAMAVIENLKHRNTKGSAFHMLYFAAIKPVLQIITKMNGASRKKSRVLDMMTPAE